MKTIQIGMIGTGFMAKTHSMAIASYTMKKWPVLAIPVRKTIAGRTPEKAQEAALRFGYPEWTCDPYGMINDPEIDLIIITTPNDSHMEYALAAMRAGKHVICEKPLAGRLQEAETMALTARDSAVKTMVAFNYRRLPAIELAKQILQEGRMGEIQSLHIEYMQDSGADANTPHAWRNSKSISGYGALGDIGTHIMDLARYLVGPISAVNGSMRTLYSQRPVQGDMDRYCAVDVDDEFSIAMRFANGAEGTMKASRNAWGRNNSIRFELNCAQGAIRFDMEHNGEIDVFFADEPEVFRGFTRIFTGEKHTNGEFFWPMPGMGIGYSEPLIVQLDEMIKAIIEDGSTSPNFEDGYRIARICNAVERSNMSGKWENV